jgi:hypothetical protein
MVQLDTGSCALEKAYTQAFYIGRRVAGYTVYAERIHTDGMKYARCLKLFYCRGRNACTSDPQIAMGLADSYRDDFNGVSHQDTVS